MTDIVVSEDRGFKALFTSYPMATIEVFARSLVQERGLPASVVPIKQEAPPPDLGKPSRFIDIALLATWANGDQAVILLVEHWSEARKVALRRVNWYVADLLLHYPEAVVQPTILVTDSGDTDVPHRLESTVGKRVHLVLDVDVVRITPKDASWLRGMRNRVAAVLLAMAATDAVDAAVAALSALAAAPGPVDDVRRFLALIQGLSRMTDQDEPRFRGRLQEAAMVTVLDEIKAEGEAKGKAEGLVAGIRHRVAKGTLTIDAARAEIQELVTEREIPYEVGQQALVLLG
jgi:hypothetical protein